MSISQIASIMYANVSLRLTYSHLKPLLGINARWIGSCYLSHSHFFFINIICFDWLLPDTGRLYVWCESLNITLILRPLSLCMQIVTVCGRNLRKKFINKQIYANKQKHTKVLVSDHLCGTSFWKHSSHGKCSFSCIHRIEVKHTPCTNDERKFSTSTKKIKMKIKIKIENLHRLEKIIFPTSSMEIWKRAEIWREWDLVEFNSFR